MKKIMLAGIISTLFIGNAHADDYILDLVKLDGDFVEESQELELKYQADLGGYSYMQIMTEETLTPSLHTKGKKFGFGIGVEEKWKRERLSADVYMDIGYFTAQFDQTDIATSTLNKTKYNGMQYRAGIKFHPFSDNIDIKVEVRNDSSASISGKSARVWGGIGYKVGDFKFSVMASDDDLVKAGISIRF